ncbi:hypothetical protein QQP08_021477 [Theobroma cacao]|nr:hypothetical protein QQP08_021477 [Theobroma cacao]
MLIQLQQSTWHFKRSFPGKGWTQLCFSWASYVDFFLFHTYESAAEVDEWSET